MTTPVAALQQIWTAGGCDPGTLGRVTLTGADPMLPTEVKIGTAATAVIAATALAAAKAWHLRTGRAPAL